MMIEAFEHLKKSKFERLKQKIDYIQTNKFNQSKIAFRNPLSPIRKTRETTLITNSDIINSGTKRQPTSKSPEYMLQTTSLLNINQ